METNSFTKSALQVLEETSRTFYIPISYLPPTIKEAVASAYLCLRAIDEIEDHPTLENSMKAKILRSISYTLQTTGQDPTIKDLTNEWFGMEKVIPEVSLRLAEWCLYCPKEIRPRICDVTATMADRMAYWAENNWKISTIKDLNAYTFSVAGAVGLLLSELWEWYEGTKTSRELAVAFGRGLQAVNILRNKNEDKERGVSFYPDGWTDSDMQQYARANLELAKEYMDSLPEDSAAMKFCKIPYALAIKTLDFLATGKEKLSRSDVLLIVKECLKSQTSETRN
jgi:Phytoene/squalene synthetase